MYAIIFVLIYFSGRITIPRVWTNEIMVDISEADRANEIRKVKEFLEMISRTQAKLDERKRQLQSEIDVDQSEDFHARATSTSFGGGSNGHDE